MLEHDVGQGRNALRLEECDGRGRPCIIRPLFRVRLEIFIELRHVVYVIQTQTHVVRPH